MARESSLKRSLAWVVLLAVVVPGIFANAAANARDGSLSVTAVVCDQGPGRASAVEDEGETRWRSRFPENPELYVPMPIPAPTEPVVTQPETRVLSYDLMSGEEVVSDIYHEDVPLFAWAKAKAEKCIAMVVKLLMCAHGLDPKSLGRIGFFDSRAAKGSVGNE